MNPFRLDGPAVVSFSGGRTSAFMLRRILDAHDGTLPTDVHVIFCNTGEEHPATLDFVQECAERWGVPVTWLEYDGEGGRAGGRKRARVREVTHATASRAGEPFDKLLAARRFLPNPTARFCTESLKMRPMIESMKGRGYEHWLNVVGLRADEPHRAASRRADNATGENPWTTIMPLYSAGLAVADVRAFWRAQPFDLRCPDGFGNCTRCFMKGTALQIYLAQEDPASSDRWVAREKLYKARFHRDMSYTKVAAYARSQGRLALPVLTEGVSCACTD